MFKINQNYLKLPGNYLFTEIAKKIEKYQSMYPEKEIIRMGIGDVTQPLAPAIIEALHNAVEEMSREESFHGYAPDKGYSFLREKIAIYDYQSRGCSVEPDEIFISDGAKCDSANIQEILAIDNKIAVCDPVYPVYVESNVMAGRTGIYNEKIKGFEQMIYLPCTAENNFLPEFPKEVPDVIYLCFPNNPTGAVITKNQLQQWVNYANKYGILLIYDAAYEAYITESEIPHSIYECEGAATCAIELRSFSKNAGFTGVRLGYTVVPKELTSNGIQLHSLWSRRHGTKYNGAPYIVQKAGEAVYSEMGKKQIQEQVDRYMKNAHLIYHSMKESGYQVSGGVNAPYVWVKTPGGVSSWQFFDQLLQEANVVGTPGSGFGACGEGYLRLSAFGTYENTVKAMDRIKNM